jgi:hypothetical protein
MSDYSMHHQTDSAASSDVAWREALLRSAGFERMTASMLARDDGVDIDELLELVDRGCPPHLAARILVPLESERTPS